MMRFKRNTEPKISIAEKYSDRNPSLEHFYFTRRSNPWRVRAQLAYIVARRALFALQPRPPSILETDLVISHRHHVVIVTIPKAGSRSLMAAFLDRWSEPGSVESEATSLETLLERHSAARLYSVLATVRNPWDRVYSCYRDKIARLDRNRGRAHLIARYRGLRPFMPFEAFVEWLASEEGADENADRHWASQSAFLRLGDSFRCDHIFKLEALENDIDRLRSVLGEPSFVMPRTNVLANSSASTRREVFNSYTRALIAKRYEEDIDRFRYVF